MFWTVICEPKSGGRSLEHPIIIHILPSKFKDKGRQSLTIKSSRCQLVDLLDKGDDQSRDKLHYCLKYKSGQTDLEHTPSRAAISFPITHLSAETARNKSIHQLLVSNSKTDCISRFFHGHRQDQY